MTPEQIAELVEQFGPDTTLADVQDRMTRPEWPGVTDRYQFLMFDGEGVWSPAMSAATLEHHPFILDLNEAPWRYRNPDGTPGDLVDKTPSLDLTSDPWPEGRTRHHDENPSLWQRWHSDQWFWGDDTVRLNVGCHGDYWNPDANLFFRDDPGGVRAIDRVRAWIRREQEAGRR